jgi:hypothetical protein
MPKILVDKGDTLVNIELYLYTTLYWLGYITMLNGLNFFNLFHMLSKTRKGRIM